MFRAIRKASYGFTLIELVIVITILAILAAVAIPNYVNLTGDAKSAAVAGVAGALTSASAVNYAARVQNSSLGSAITNCTGASALLAGGLPTGYTITSAAVANGASVTCTITGNGSTTSFMALGIT